MKKIYVIKKEDVDNAMVSKLDPKVIAIAVPNKLKNMEFKTCTTGGKAMLDAYSLADVLLTKILNNNEESYNRLVRLSKPVDSCNREVKCYTPTLYRDVVKAKMTEIVNKIDKENELSCLVDYRIGPFTGDRYGASLKDEDLLIADATKLVEIELPENGTAIPAHARTQIVDNLLTLFKENGKPIKTISVPYENSNDEVTPMIGDEDGDPKKELEGTYEKPLVGPITGTLYKGKHTEESLLELDAFRSVIASTDTTKLTDEQVRDLVDNAIAIYKSKGIVNGAPTSNISKLSEFLNEQQEKIKENVCEEIRYQRTEEGKFVKYIPTLELKVISNTQGELDKLLTVDDAYNLLNGFNVDLIAKTFIIGNILKDRNTEDVFEIDEENGTHVLVTVNGLNGAYNKLQMDMLYNALPEESYYKPILNKNGDVIEATFIMPVDFELCIKLFNDTIIEK